LIGGKAQKPYKNSTSHSSLALEFLPNLVGIGRRVKSKNAKLSLETKRKPLREFLKQAESTMGF
jgi:hypothetical protein